MMAREGYPFVGVAVGIWLVLYWILGPWGWMALALPLLVAAFFRDPERYPPSQPRILVAPADGKVIDVCEVKEGHYLKRRVKRLSIFLSIFDVHINRIPCSGSVKGIYYHRGSFLPAFREKTSEQNERNVVWIQTEEGRELLVVQIAGLIARRIICRLKEGARVSIGERFGLIRFGSRVDLYLPEDVEVDVAVGSRVRGGETVLARWR